MRVQLAEIRSTPPRRHLAQWLMGLLGVVWLAGMGWALFQFQTVDQRLFDAAVLEGSEVPDAELSLQLQSVVPVTDRPLLVHAWDDRCECAQAAWEHLLSLRESIAAADAGVVLLVKPEALDRAERAKAAAEAAGLEIVGITIDRQRNLVPASPASAVLGADGGLVYLGPYSAGGSCVTSLGGFVESSLKALREPLEGRAPWINRTAIGCYCDWASEPVTDA